MGWISRFGFLLTWWGLLLIAAVDSTIFFMLPFGNDALVVYLAARHRDPVWIYPLVATIGSTAGAAATYWIGLKAGENGLPKLVSERRLNWVRQRVHKAGALAIALPATLPPPFPLTPFILTYGALQVSAWRLLTVYAGARLVRFGVEAYFGQRYGVGVIRVLESDTFKWVIGGFIAVTVIGTVWSGITLWRRSRQAA